MGATLTTKMTRQYRASTPFAHALLRLSTLALLISLWGCTSFATPKSASVRPGFDLLVQGSLSAPPGDGPAWFWAGDCATDCDQPIASGEAALAYGWALGGSRGLSVAIGANSNQPFAEAFGNLSGGGGSPWGLGARIGVTRDNWHEDRLFARYDRVLNDRTRLLLSPALLRHSGESPNGRLRGHFVAASQSVGLSRGFPSHYWVLGVTVVVGRGRRTGFGSFNSAFVVGSLGIVF